MGVKKTVKEVGSGVGKGAKAIGKGVWSVSTAIYGKTFLITTIVGACLSIFGLVTVMYMATQDIKLTNLKPLFGMITGAVFAIVGVVLIGTAFGIRWKRQMFERITFIEELLSRILAERQAGEPATEIEEGR